MPEVYFVGCGPGDPELLTVKAANLMGRADLTIYSGSLIPGEILERCAGERRDASGMVREEITDALREAALKGKLVLRLHDGDPTIYGAIREQIDSLEGDGISCTVVPGVTAMLASAAALKTQLTLPGVTQTIIVTRVESRTGVPEQESLESLARHRATMVLYLSVHLLGGVAERVLAGGYPRSTPVAVVYRAGWKDQTVVTGTIQDIAAKVRSAGITRTATIIIGDVVEPERYEYSRLYDRNFSHGFRKARDPEPRPSGPPPDV